MAINIINPVNDNYTPNGVTGVYEILADTESDILALTDNIACTSGCKYYPAPGSIAYTADLSVAYQLSPSGVWTKIKG